MNNISNVNKARYFIKKAAVHNYLRSMLRNIKLEKIAQTSTVSGYLSPEEYQRLSTDDFNGTSASDLNSWKIQRMRKMRDAVKAKQQLQDQQSRPVPLPDPSNGRYAQIAQQLDIKPTPIPNVPQGRWSRQQPTPQPNPTQGGSPQFAPNNSRISRGRQGGTAPFTPSNSAPIRRGRQGGTGWR